MGFRIDQARRTIDEVRTVTDASRKDLEDIVRLSEELSDFADVDESEVLDENAREHLVEHFDDVHKDLDSERQSELDQLAACAEKLRKIDELTNEALADTKKVRNSLEDSAVAQLIGGAINELCCSEEELLELRKELAGVASEIDGLVTTFSQGIATLDATNSEGARRREALERLTDAVESLGDLEDYVLSGADERLREISTEHVIPLAGATTINNDFASYIAERSNVIQLASCVADTRFDDVHESIDDIGSYVDATGSVFSGAVSAAAAVAILAKEEKQRRRSSRKGGV